jgi:hypothetical protein
MTRDITITLAPYLPYWALAIAFLAASLVLGYAIFCRARGALWRAALLGLLWAGLANPTLVIEERRLLSDVAVVLVDESASQRIGERRRRSEEALEKLQERIARLPGIELRVVRVGTSKPHEEAVGEGGTRIFQALERALADVPPQRVSGAIVITDGQAHDVPAAVPFAAPLHVLLSGDRGESDRRLIVEQAPRFGIVGKDVPIQLRIEDPSVRQGDLAKVTLREADGVESEVMVPVGVSHPLQMRIPHGGTTIVELSVAPGLRELTLDNNRAVIAVNGVRERLRVLLVSGEPHAGERTWRNLLKSDPTVDLIHFTILRPPEKQDRTPVRELSLIAFPVRELFEVKLHEFDLIIFDRYHSRGILPRAYLENVATYVRGGGALLESSGENLATPLGLFQTPLGAVLPGEPTNIVYERGFTPQVSEVGQRHPVTAGLAAGTTGQPNWGRWFRQVDLSRRSGNVVMEGVERRPLMLLDRVGEGRVAQIASDQIWLWARGFEGGGPQAELLRRLAHWLMKEPELEEEDLRAQVRGGEILISRQTLAAEAGPVTITGPSGEKREVTLRRESPGRYVGNSTADEPGLYRLNDRERHAVTAVGPLNPIELSDVRTTGEKLRAVVEATGGSINWLVDEDVPQVRRIRADRDHRGRGWIGLQSNEDYEVTGIKAGSLPPAWLLLLLTLAAALVAWRREGR